MLTLVILSCFITICGSQKRTQAAPRWDCKANNSEKTCSNLTQVLDNWKFAILTQVKDMLINDHSSVLPEYSRIEPLSNALRDLYTQFNKLKEELRGLTTKVDEVETIVDEIKDVRLLHGRLIQKVPAGGVQMSALRGQRRPNRVMSAQLKRVRRRGN